MYKYYYETQSGMSNIIMTGEDDMLTSLCFVGSKDAQTSEPFPEEKKLPVFEETINWLNIYFSGKSPDFTPKMNLEGLSDFRREVTEKMLAVPFGQTATYNGIAKEIASERGIAKMSAQAVGGAVGANKICIIIPCHRVIGSDGSLVGYGGGMENKKMLLKNEGIKY